MRIYFGLVLVLLFACSVAVLVVFGIGAVNSGLPGFQGQFGEKVREASEVFDLFPRRDFVNYAKKAEEEKSAQNKARFARRREYVTLMNSEISAVITPGVTSELIYEIPSEYEVDEHTFEAVSSIFTPYLNDPDPEFRAAALMCMQFYFDKLPELGEHIWPAITDPDEEVSKCAASLLKKIALSADDAPTVIGFLDHEPRYTKGFAMSVMKVWGELDQHAPDMDKQQLLPAVPRLFEIVNDPDSYLSRGAAEVLSNLGPLIPGELDRTIELLRTGDAMQQKLSTLILLGMGASAKPAIPLLEKRLEANAKRIDDGYEFQIWVAEAILEIDPGLVDMVAIKLAKNLGQTGEDGWMETKLLKNLGADASAAIPILQSYQVGKVDQAYLHATEAISHMTPDDPEVIAELLQLLPAVCEHERYWIIDGLGRATTNFELGRTGLEWVLAADDVLDQERAQAILDLHPIP